MVSDISGKKILFFSPAFFQYEDLIADKMREMGAEVDMYDVRSVTGAMDRALLKISPVFFQKRSQRYYEDIIEQNKGKDYDFILIVKCDMTPVNILERFKVEYPNAKLCLNLWDSVENIPGIIQKFKYFDTLHSFDPDDCEKYKILKFRQLFFADQFRKEQKADEESFADQFRKKQKTDEESTDRKNVKKKECYKYDISFLGTIHSDRFAVIRQVQRIAKQRGLKCYWFLYLQSRFIYQFYKVTKREFRGVSERVFKFDKMSADDIAKVIDQSRIILDIQHPMQTGLTIRTIEMIGMNKKLITTNAAVKKYDFYHADNIAVVDRKNVEISEKFLKSRYTPLPEDVYEKYSLKSWILEVLS